jgi:hypothetical protein
MVGGWVRLLVCAFAISSLGCDRVFTLTTSSRIDGQSCIGGASCASGVCADGVCCGSVCGPTQVCNGPGSAGTCTDRPLGASCGDDTTCPSGYCRDGVCCDSSCSGNCLSCAVDGGQGHCQDAPDNTDPHVDCGTCAACFGGDCGPAFADTDPHGECGVGQTCSGNYTPSVSGACGIADGYPCVDDSCAGYSGYCISWRCAEVGYFHVDSYPFLPTDQHRTPLAMAVSSEGAVAILVDTLDGSSPAGDLLGNVVAVLAPQLQGPWNTASIEYNATGRRVGAVAFTGDVAYFAVASDIAPQSPDAAGYGYSGIYTQAITALGQLQGFENPDPGADTPLQIALGSDQQGQLTLASVVDGGALRVNVRGANGTWGNVQVVDTQVSGVALARLAGQTYLFYLARGALHAVHPDGSAEVAGGMPAACAGPLAASAAPDDGGDQAGLTLSCGAQLYLGAYAPGRTDVAPWRFVAAPATTPYYGLEDDGVTYYPLLQVLPSGGRGGAVAFMGLEPGGAPGAPQGGYTQTFWLDLDGGLAFTVGSGSDSAYRYVGMAAAASLSGGPVSAYDTVIDVDGGTVANNSTLLIQTYFP